MRNGVMCAGGWLSTEKSGESISYTDTYNDKFNSLIADGAEPQIVDNVIKEANNNVLSISNATEVKQTVSLPTLRAIGTAKDGFDILAGVKTHRISEWITIPQPTSYALCLNSYSDFKRISITQLWDYNYPLSNPVYAVKYDGKRLSNQTTYLYTDCITGATTDIGTRISVSNIDSGWSVALTPSAAEIKAYFLGWQMCHDDGNSPYYKSEVPYTPSTWAEWTKYNAIGDSTGITFSLSNTTGSIQTPSPITLKPNTKYGLLFNIIENSMTASFYGKVAGTVVPSNATLVSNNGEVGNKRFVVTLPGTLSDVNLKVASNYTGSGTLKIKDIRLYELPTGSQIEADFTNLTADQLAIKYPFYGLNPKNWKHITDGTGLTATLPTATYAGYTPYRLLYQLATPAEEQLTGTSVPTYPWHTDIAQTGDALTTITANAKVMD